jgi:hypothetical protein
VLSSRLTGSSLLWAGGSPLRVYSKAIVANNKIDLDNGGGNTQVALSVLALTGRLWQIRVLYFKFKQALERLIIGKLFT